MISELKVVCTDRTRHRAWVFLFAVVTSEGGALDEVSWANRPPVPDRRVVVRLKCPLCYRDVRMNRFDLEAAVERAAKLDLEFVDISYL